MEINDRPVSSFLFTALNTVLWLASLAMVVFDYISVFLDLDPLEPSNVKADGRLRFKYTRRFDRSVAFVLAPLPAAALLSLFVSVLLCQPATQLGLDTRASLVLFLTLSACTSIWLKNRYVANYNLLTAAIRLDPKSYPLADEQTAIWAGFSNWKEYSAYYLFVQQQYAMDIYCKAASSRGRGIYSNIHNDGQYTIYCTECEPFTATFEQIQSWAGQFCTYTFDDLDTIEPVA